VILIKRLYKNRDRLLFLFALIVIYFVWSFNSSISLASEGLDSSWVLGLNWAKNVGAHWGKEFIFTYGPLYYFTGYVLPVFSSYRAYLLIQVGINLFYSVIKASIVFFFFYRANSLYKIYAAIFSGLVMLLCGYDKLELLVFFAALLLCDSYYKLSVNSIVMNRKLVINNALASLLLVIAQYAKFSFFNIAAVLIILLSILYISHRKYKIAIIFAGSYIFLSILLWIISGQRIKNLFGYIYTGLQLSSGYTPAMNTYYGKLTFFTIFVYSLVVIGSFMIILLYFAIKKRYFLFSLCFFISPQLFLLFKESFVRADGSHVNVFMRNIPLIALYLLFVSVLFPRHQQRNKLFGINTSKCVIILAIIVTCISISVTNVKYPPKNNASKILQNYVYYDDKIHDDKIQKNKQNIRNYYGNYKELTPYISTNEKIDIFPWDISLLYAYDLNWQPRPVIQSYTNYTSALDNFTARHFLTEKAPDKLIYTPMSIDNRYALFDEPETFRTVLLNYSSVVYNGAYLILEKNKQVNPENIEELYTMSAKIGEIIEVPFFEDSYVFMEVDWDFNFLGKLANFIYKTTNANIELHLADGAKPGHRFVHKTARNGLFVSKYVSTTYELREVFDRGFIPDITGVRILAKKLFYKNNINVKFYKIKFSKTMMPIANIPIPQDISSILINDIYSITRQNDILVIHCGTSDPYICFPLKEPINKISFPTLEINYSTSTAGNIQFFYDFGNGYSEINSYSTRLEISSDTQTLRIPVIGWLAGTNLVSVRIDPPDGTEFELESIMLIGEVYQ